MPSKKKKYNARFPAGRIKKIMQTDEEVGKVAQAVPVIISRTLELFVESLLIKSMQITQTRCAKTLTPSHMKQCILSENRFDFLKDLVKNIPDASVQEDNENNDIEAIDYSTNRNMEEDQTHKSESTPIVANFYTEQSTSAGRTPVIQYSPKISNPAESAKTNTVRNEPAMPMDVKVEQLEQPQPVPSLVPTIFSIDSLVKKEPKIHIDLSNMNPAMQVDNSTPGLIQNSNTNQTNKVPTPAPQSDIPPLIPISSHNYYTQQTVSDNLYIDEDYDN